MSKRTLLWTLFAVLLTGFATLQFIPSPQSEAPTEPPEGQRGQEHQQ